MFKKRMQNSTKKQKTTKDKVLDIVGIVLCVILGFILVCNMTIIIKGSVHPEEPPSIFSVTPLVVVSPSMQGDQKGIIYEGDLIFIKDIAFEDLEIGDVVTYREPNGDLVTHRIIRQNDDGSYVTKGDNPVNDEDIHALTADTLVGIVIGRIPKIGDFALFLQTTLGTVLFVGLPLLAFVVYDIIRRQLYAKKDNDKTAELEAELARLRALAGEAPAAAPAEAPAAPIEETPAADSTEGE